MKVKGKYEYNYSAINIVYAVATRFRSFSKKISKSHTSTLVLIMDFFEWHGFFPTQRFEKKFMEEILKNRKRTEANIAILRDIEQTQTKPLSIQMDLLFEGRTTQRERPKRVEKLFVDSQGVPDTNLDKAPVVPRVELDRTKGELDHLRSELAYVLDRVKLVKGTLGKDHLRLEMSPTRFQTLKAIFERKNK